MSDHHCHALRCKTPCRPELLMCGPHWAKVPKHIQSMVYRAYRPGQCDDKEPSAEWHEAADLAIGYVAMKEHSIGSLVRSHLRALLKHEPTALKAACIWEKRNFEALVLWVNSRRGTP